MPKVSRDSATQGGEFGPVVDRSERARGYTVEFHVVPRGHRRRRRCMKGLPDDRCQCPHWGYVVTGKVTFRYADREEVFEAGDAFYTPPGHVPVKHEPGTEVVMFSPADELRKTEAVMMKNMQAMQAADAQAGTRAGNSSSGSRPCCIAKRPAAARLEALIFA